jgi:phage baseplate assembly protein W
MAKTVTTNYVYSDFDIELPRQNDGDITKDTDLDSVRNSIINILQTKKGSRRMLPTFGCDLDTMLFEPMDDRTAHWIGTEILGAIEIWEPRVILQNINVYPSYDNNQYDIRVTFGILGFNQNTGVGMINLILKRV